MSSDQTRALRGSQPHRATGKSHRGPNYRGRRKPGDPTPPTTSSAPNESSALGLDTLPPAAEAPSAPAPPKTEGPEATPRVGSHRNGRQSSRPRGNGRGSGRGRSRRPEQESADPQADSAPSNENLAPEVSAVTQTTPAPNTDGVAPPRGPRGRGRGRGRGNGFGRGNSRPRGIGRADQQPNDTVTSSSSNISSATEPNTEPDSSSTYSSSVPTPVNPHANLAPVDETAAACPTSGKQSAASPGIKQAEEVGLDLWAERPPDASMWRSDSPEAPVECAYAPARPVLPANPSPHPGRADQPPRTRQTPAGPTRVETPQPSQTPPIQPPIDDSPTSMRRVGLAHVLLGPGGSVQHIFTDAESPWVMLSNLPRSTRKHHVEALVAPFGTTQYIRVYGPKANTHYLATARILFDRHEQAREAVSSLHGQVVNRGPITARLDIDVGGSVVGSHIPGLPDAPSGADTQPQAQSSLVASDPAAVVKSCTVKVSWLAPTSTVYVTYKTTKFALERLKELNGRTFWNRRMRMTPMFSEKDNNLERVARESGGYMIRITGLMGSPDLDALRRLLRSNDIVVNPNYSFDIGLTRLREDMADVAPLESFRLLPNRRDDFKLHAMAQYTTPTAAANAVKIFEKRRSEYLGNSPVWVSRHLAVRYSISQTLTDVLQGDINKLHSWAMDDPDLHVRQQEEQHKPGFVQLTLSGNDTKQLVAAKAQLDRALAGVPLSTPEGLKIWDPYFTTEDGASFLESVAKSSNVCARADRRTNSILLFGPGYARDEASKLLREKLEEHRRLKQVLTIPKPIFRRLAMGGLTILRDLLGKGGIYVNIFTESLTFYGNDEAVRQVKKAIDVMYSEVGSRLPRRSDCVVCLCKPDRALLFHCGHHYCRACFSQYVSSAAENRTLPLVCVGNDCKAPIPLSMITQHASQSDQDALFYAAFQAHISAHPDQYRYCPTADCQYIYRVGPEDAVVQCRLCLTNICTHCHIEQHEGISCADYKASHDESEIQKSFDRWRAANNVKPCPNCAAPIEKIAGCNHMMCSACRTHMCWVCLSGFPTGDAVYEHMRSKHGGIGL